MLKNVTIVKKQYSKTDNVLTMKFYNKSINSNFLANKITGNSPLTTEPKFAMLRVCKKKTRVWCPLKLNNRKYDAFCKCDSFNNKLSPSQKVIMF